MTQTHENDLGNLHSDLGFPTCVLQSIYTAKEGEQAPKDNVYIAHTNRCCSGRVLLDTRFLKEAQR